MPLGILKAVSGPAGLGRRRGPPPFAPMAATGGTVSDVTIGGVTYRIHAFTTIGTNTFTVTSPGVADILLVGGGGGGSHLSPTGSWGAGGGGGGVVEQLQISVAAQTYTITVGNGGLSQYQSSGTDGGATTALGYTAGGGKRGNSRDGGNSGTPQNFPGSSGRSYANQGFISVGNGGGAGGGAIGGTVDGATNNSYQAGPGYLTSFTGNAVYYSAGAKGFKGNGDTTSNGTGWSSSAGTFGHGARAPTISSPSGNGVYSRPGVAYIRYIIA